MCKSVYTKDKQPAIEWRAKYFKEKFHWDTCTLYI